MTPRPSAMWPYGEATLLLHLLQKKVLHGRLFCKVRGDFAFVWRCPAGSMVNEYYADKSRVSTLPSLRPAALTGLGLAHGVASV